MAKSFHHLKTHTHDEAEGQQIEMIAHPGGDGDHVRLAASQCCGGSERVWRGGAAQGTSQYHRPAASSQQATALPIVSSLARRTEMPPLWRSSLQRAQRRKRCCGQPARACGPAPAGKEQNVGANQPDPHRGTPRTAPGAACFFAAFVRTAADQVHSRTCMRCSLSSFLSFLRDPVRKH